MPNWKLSSSQHELNQNIILLEKRLISAYQSPRHMPTIETPETIETSSLQAVWRSERLRQQFIGNNFDHQKKSAQGLIAEMLKSKQPTYTEQEKNRLQKRLYAEKLVNRHQFLKHQYARKLNAWKNESINIQNEIFGDRYQRINFDNFSYLHPVIAADKTISAHHTNIRPLLFPDNTEIPVSPESGVILPGNGDPTNFAGDHQRIIKEVLIPLREARSEHSKIIALEARRAQRDTGVEDQLQVNNPILTAIMLFIENSVLPVFQAQQELEDFEKIFGQYTGQWEEDLQNESIDTQNQAGSTLTVDNYQDSIDRLIDYKKELQSEIEKAKTKPKNDPESQYRIAELQKRIKSMEEIVSLTADVRSIEDPATGIYHELFNDNYGLKFTVGNVKLQKSIEEARQYAEETLFANLPNGPSQHGVKEFFLYLCLTKPDIDIQQLRNALENIGKSPSANIFYMSIAQKISSKYQNHQIVYPLNLTASERSMLEKLLSNENYKEYCDILFSGDKIERLQQEVQHGEETAVYKKFENDYNINLQQSADKCIDSEAVKEVRGWFDNQGNLLKKPDRQNIEKWLIVKLPGQAIKINDLLNNQNDLYFLFNHIVKTDNIRLNDRKTKAKLETYDDQDNFVSKGFDGLMSMIQSGDTKEMALGGILIYAALKGLFSKEDYGKYVRLTVLGLAGNEFLKSTYGVDLLETANITNKEANFRNTKFQAQIDLYDLRKKYLNTNEIEEQALKSTHRSNIMRKMNELPMNELMIWEEKTMTDLKNSSGAKGKHKTLFGGMPAKLKEYIQYDIFGADNEAKQNEHAFTALGLISLFYKEIAYSETSQPNKTEGKKILLEKYLNQQGENYDKQKTMGAVLDEKITPADMEYSVNKDKTIQDKLMTQASEYYEDLKPYVDSVYCDSLEKFSLLWGKLKTVFAGKIMENLAVIKENSWTIMNVATDYVEIKWAENSPMLKRTAQGLMFGTKEIFDLAWGGLWQVPRFLAWVGNTHQIKKGMLWMEPVALELYQQWLGINPIPTKSQLAIAGNNWQDQDHAIELLGKYHETIQQTAQSTMQVQFSNGAYYIVGKVEMDPTKHAGGIRGEASNMPENRRRVEWKTDADRQAKQLLNEYIQQKGIRGDELPPNDWEANRGRFIISYFEIPHINGNNEMCVALRIPSRTEAYKEKQENEGSYFEAYRTKTAEQYVKDQWTLFISTQGRMQNLKNIRLMSTFSSSTGFEWANEKIQSWVSQLSDHEKITIIKGQKTAKLVEVFQATYNLALQHAEQK